jgi:hypothetical protein
MIAADVWHREAHCKEIYFEYICAVTVPVVE